MEITESTVAAHALTSISSHTLGELVDSIAALERMEASIAGFKAELIEQARVWSELVEAASAKPEDRGWNAEVRARRVVASELACALRLPERSAESLVEISRMLSNKLPATLRALCEGAISWRHAKVLVDHACSIDASFAEQFEAAVLPFAKTLTVTKFDRKARAVRERIHPESIDDRHEMAMEKRSIDLQPAEDGMAHLYAYLPVVTAQGIHNRLTDMAMKHKAAAESRTLAQLRADLFADLLLNGTLAAGRDGGIRARVLVTVPVLTLLGKGDEPAELEGYGPIDRVTALKLAAKAPSFTRLLTHPETGAVLSVGRNSYAVPADLRTWLRVRDGTCRFPGCSRAARNCEIDHTEDWQHGNGTNHDNLAHLCPAHHHLKHQTGWAVRQTGAGVLEWTSPNGRVYSTEPETVLPVWSEDHPL